MTFSFFCILMMNMDPIEKLKERLSQDPSSTLFLPLAEEYRKKNMLDEAINVLKSGLEKNPNYMSAHVALGKIYIERGLIKDAIEEFETVINAIPDNLFAYKKLSELYSSIGETEKAENTYQKVLSLNPDDEEAMSALKEISSPHESSQTAELETEIEKIDGFIKEERFLEAIKSFKDLLERFPGNKQIMQRLEEVKSYAKMLNIDFREITYKLDNFLTEVHRRENDFKRKSNKSA